MADTKISALTGATTPLAGTEVLPIVQGGATVKVSVANLTAGRAVATAGGSFTDNVTQSTAGKGVNFTANTPAAGMTSQLLNWYEEGTWTPEYQTTGSAPTITYLVQLGRYTRIGRIVLFNIELVTTAKTGGTGNMRIGGLPFTIAQRYSALPVSSYWLGWTTAAPITGVGVNGNTFFELYSDNATNSTAVPIANLTDSAVYLYMSGSYLV